MFQNVYSRFSGGSMMLMRREGDTVSFVGTAFIVHPDGYLLTVAHILPEGGELVVSPRDHGAEFVPAELERVASHPARVIRVDTENDVALLGFSNEIGVGMPDHLVGEPDAVLPGTSVACVGHPFGFHHVYNQCVLPGTVLAKVTTPRESKLFLLDVLTDEGLRGAPVVDTTDGRVIGILGGRFHPRQIARAEDDLPAPSGMSFAMSIEYGAALLEAEGVEVI